ncbi:ADP-ribosyl-[dinitrogen reductase] hydrolase [Geobacter hydrogenophilus]|uniref:ADP-ribosyl-[dinitrogen reductase] hydrolase n=1 Tax=Geobacter hydrogenophilus TaxID=40983 RepID=A0A9W6G1I5_9BACT|nr:ADP-ribosyl-[dinitrogen reductase] hydrolase [Geobacter hydrogenophilus]MBT0892817.1 ADP-ribosyl-[dinitrogen reductase] hydrolase [Geobacter hydrogenophilus]GLI38709.1 ADP-ribosyl-[dinitrogen reductase] hydrolase [Geobacter hydrogenophilus]
MPHFLDHHDIRSRARAAFIGLAVGDALGAPVEFMTAGEIRSKHGVLREIVGGGWLRLKPGQVTDDTEMSLCVARAIVAAGGWSLRGIADEFAGWLRTKPVDVGDTCRRGIRNFMLKGILETPFNQWDAGNGAAMRMLPAALYTLGDDDLLQCCALEQARITHNHPLSDAACITLGRLVHLALQGASRNRLRREADLLAADHPAFTFTPYRGLATGYVVDTVQTVFHHFFRGRSFEECLVGTVNQGGDADTTGAICGMVAGAFYGMEGIPQRWLKRMERRTMTEIADLSARLIALSPALRE